MSRMVRTNVVIDEVLIEKVMCLFGMDTKREAVGFALHAVLGDEDRPITDPWKAALELEGIWADRSEEELRAIYGHKIPDKPDS